MTHWGWYWRVKLQHMPKKLCENLHRLDAFWVMKQFSPRDSATQGCTASIDNAFTRILITRQPCNFGGFRYFFACPGCTKRMRFLYFDDIHKFFRCRRCLDLGYYTQRLRRSELYLWRHAVIENRLLSRGGSLRKRPSGMSGVSFKRLVERHWTIEFMLESIVEREIIEWNGLRHGYSNFTNGST